MSWTVMMCTIFTVDIGISSFITLLSKSLNISILRGIMCLKTAVDHILRFVHLNTWGKYMFGTVT